MYNTPTLMIWQYDKGACIPSSSYAEIIRGIFCFEYVVFEEQNILLSVSINVKNLVGCVDFLIQWWAQVN